MESKQQISEFKYYQRLNEPIQNEGVLNVENPQLQSHFFYIFVGQPGSGKSFLMEELILNKTCYRNKFNEILFFAPYEIGTDLELDQDNYRSTIDLQMIYGKIKEYNQRENKQKRINLLLVVDDLITMLKKEQNECEIINLFYNRRKLIQNGTISIMLSTQQYKMIPAKLRTCITGAWIFKTNNQDWDNIFNEILFYNKNTVKQHLLTMLSKTKYSFLHIRLDTYTCYINWTPLQFDQ